MIKNISKKNLKQNLKLMKKMVVGNGHLDYVKGMEI